MTSHLIGRDQQVRILQDLITRTLDSHGGLALISGDAGVGKTALAATAAQHAQSRGLLVLNGACWDPGSAPDYWPWVQVVRALRSGASATAWEAGNEIGSSLSIMLGETVMAEPDEFRLHDGVTTALVSAAHHQPLAVVLEDLHWADAASVRLLDFVARHTWFERILLLGTYRDLEPVWHEHPVHAVADTLLGKATTITLTGLGRDEVGTLMARHTGHEPTSDLVSEVHRRTGGNPFFVEQTVHLLAAGDEITAIPPGVADVVHQRLARLPAAEQRLLETAAVAGHEFHRDVIAALSSNPGSVERLLPDLVAARLLNALGHGRFAFAQDLVRETIYRGLPPRQVCAAHAAIVHAVTRHPHLGASTLPSELARHAQLAGTAIPAGRAVELLLAAADDADRRMAVDESVEHHRRALGTVPADDARTIVDVALRLGTRLRRRRGRSAADAAFTRAAAAAREVGDALLLTRVALTVYRRDLTGEDRVGLQLIREAHDALGLAEAPGRRESDRDGGEEPSTDRLLQELATHGVVEARRHRDDNALAFALRALHDVTWGPGTAPQREAVTTELAQVGHRTGSTESDQFALSLRWVALLELGDARYLGAHHEFVALAMSRESPRYALAAILDRAIVATFRGQFDGADALLDQATGHAGFDQHWTFVVDHLRWALRLMQGRYAELDGLHARLAAHGPRHGQLVAAISTVQRGDVPTALRHLVESSGRAHPYPRIYVPLWLRFQAQVAAASGRRELCQQIRASLQPYVGQWAVSLYGCDISGPYQLWCAVLDAALEHWEDAIVGFTAAGEAAERLHSRPWSLQARAGLALALIGRGQATDAEAAATLLNDVERESIEIGMNGLVEHIRQARAPAMRAPVTAADGAFRFDGQVWQVSYAGRSVYLPDAKGLGDLHQLLSCPGQEVAALRLVERDHVATTAHLGADPVLDDAALAHYRRRLAQLDEHIDWAVARGDDGVAARHDGERAALLAQLRSAVGLHGRSRRLGDDAERARKAVTGRIRAALRRLEDHHPELANHLNATISTGLTCTYRPPTKVSWELR